MVPQPMNPTSLLLQHQLHREHGYLLNRVKSIEAQNSILDTTLRTVDENSKAVSTLRDNVINLTSDLTDVEKSVKEIHSHLERLDHESKQQTSKDVETLTSACDVIRHEIALLKAKNGQLATRIEVIEKCQTKNSKNEKLCKKDNATETRALKRRIELLESNHNEDALRLKEMQDQLSALERMNRSLVTAYQNLKRNNEDNLSEGFMTTIRYEQVEASQPMWSVPSSGQSVQLRSSPLLEKRSVAYQNLMSILNTDLRLM